MHISEGILSEPVIAVGYALAIGGTLIGLAKTDQDDIPKVAVLSAAFFVISLIHIKLCGSSTHLILNGMIGIILGWSVFPAMLIALLLQMLLFGHGGFTALGANTFNMSMGAIVCCALFRNSILNSSKKKTLIIGFVAGTLSIFISVLLAILSIYISHTEMKNIAYIMLASHVPLMIAEGIVTAFALSFLKTVCPEILLKKRKATLETT